MFVFFTFKALEKAFFSAKSCPNFDRLFKMLEFLARTTRVHNQIVLVNLQKEVNRELLVSKLQSVNRKTSRQPNILDWNSYPTKHRFYLNLGLSKALSVHIPLGVFSDQLKIVQIASAAKFPLGVFLQKGKDTIYYSLDWNFPVFWGLKNIAPTVQQLLEQVFLVRRLKCSGLPESLYTRIFWASPVASLFRNYYNKVETTSGLQRTFLKISLS